MMINKKPKQTNNNNFNIDKQIINFDKYITVLTHFLDLAYSAIYQTDISVYVASNIPISEKENKELCSKFLEYLYSLMGDNLLKEYFNLFGGEKPFISYCLLYFNNELLNADIKSIATNIINSNEEEG